MTVEHRIIHIKGAGYSFFPRFFKGQFYVDLVIKRPGPHISRSFCCTMHLDFSMIHSHNHQAFAVFRCKGSAA